MRLRSSLCVLLLFSATFALAQVRRLQSSDYLRLRSVSSVRVSPDGARVAYTVSSNNVAKGKRPEKELYVMTLADGVSLRIGDEKGSVGTPYWSPDGKWLA